MRKFFHYISQKVPYHWDSPRQSTILLYSSIHIHIHLSTTVLITWLIGLAKKTRTSKSRKLQNNERDYLPNDMRVISLPFIMDIVKAPSAAAKLQTFTWTFGWKSLKQMKTIARTFAHKSLKWMKTFAQKFNQTLILLYICWKDYLHKYPRREIF